MPASRLKDFLGHVPATAELAWALRGGDAPIDGFKLEELRAQLPGWVDAVQNSPLKAQTGRKALVFATLHYWIHHASLLSLALRGLGHDVTLAYLPHATWKADVQRFDLRRRDAYARHVFAPMQSVVPVYSFLSAPGAKLPSVLEAEIEQVSVMDVQYTQQVEEVDKHGQLFQLRLQSNRAAASAALVWLQHEQPDVVILPNGLILEFGAILHTARHLNIPVVSYEFGEQRGRIWLAHNQSVMLQETGSLWAARRNQTFTDAQRAEVQELFATRQAAGLFRHFYRKWQDAPTEGAAQVRAKLGLDARPLVLLAANVIGDSLTLGRSIFSGDMSTWLRRTLAYFAERKDVQLVLRVHPGERNLDGPSVADLVRQAMPELPENIRLVGAGDPVNTYDLVEAAQLGLVYTTTVGLEMAMSGRPVIVVGRTHYRARGFTQDPTSWGDYFTMLDRSLADLPGAQLKPAEVDQAWHYAYRFFFDYPQPFPWHLLHFAKDVEATPLAQLFTPAGQQHYARTFEYLMGEPFDWDTNQPG